MKALGVGFGLGFFVAAQLGPMSLFLMRSTLRGGLKVGLAIGAGIAAIDALYATLGAAGAGPVLTIDPMRLVLGLLGAAVLIGLGVRTFWSAFRIRHGAEVPQEVATPRRAFLTSLAGTASNPLTIASWAALFAAASAAGAANSAGSAAALVAGVGLGSLAWVSLLASGIAAARRRLGPGTIRGIDLAAGAGMVGSGGVLAVGTLREH
ncbi:MAG: putative threonine efflux protein [Solirubrobacterales bacterium]|nr:putative threonine efflux protein [Solirubrobacterales bacterium]